MVQEREIYTVTELTSNLRMLLETEFKSVWVEGEISNYVLTSSGHSYFSIKDAGSVLNCVLFKSSRESVKFGIEDGMKVLCKGRISVYDKRGQYQLYVSKVEPQGEGALGVAFEQLKKRLEKEGLFNEESKKKIPEIPTKIGIVTSPTGAAIRDILNVATRRFPNIEIIISPVKVQGTDAKEEIANAIKVFNEYNEFIEEGKIEDKKIDVVIVTRGGGSLEDLWPFNEEIVAYAIFESKIPVVSAVGHEIDYTISDFVSDLRAPTPSAAAELVVPLKEEIHSRIELLKETMYASFINKCSSLEEKVMRLKESYVLREPMNVLSQMRQRIDEIVSRITTAAKHRLEIKAKEFHGVCGNLNMLSPLAVLERGYSITFSGEKIIKSIKEIKKGQEIQTKLSEGIVTSLVEDVKSD